MFPKLSVCYTLCASIKFKNILSPGVLIEEPIHGERSWSEKELEQKQTGIACLQFEQSNRYIGSCQVEILKRWYHHVLKFPIVQIWQGGKWGLGFVACHWHPVTAQRFFGNRRCGHFLHHQRVQLWLENWPCFLVHPKRKLWCQNIMKNEIASTCIHHAPVGSTLSYITGDETDNKFSLTFYWMI